MKINFISDIEYLKAMNVGGPASALKTHRKALDLNNVQNEVNGSGEYDVVHVETPVPYAIGAVINKRYPTIISGHVTSGDMVGYLALAEITYPIIDGYLNLLYNSADMVIAPTQFTKDFLKGVGVTKEIRVISNGVDLETFKYNEEAAKVFRAKYGIREDEIVVYAVGQVVPRKGVYVFLDMAKKFPQCKFIWVGNRKWGLFQKDHLEMESLISNPPPNVIFTGFVDDIIGAHSAGDIFFFPSYYENQGIVILEAAACGSAILLRDIPVYKGWLEHNKNCLLGKDDAEFEKYISELIKEREMFSEEAQKMVQDHDLKKIGRQMTDVYNELIEKRKSGQIK
jgi:1,2-diacylglycerol-3-alpha-glucose alpha-1,2-glucosyltransferase